MEQLIIGLFLAAFSLEFLVEFGLNELNLCDLRRHGQEQRIPDFFQGRMSAGEYEMSIAYALAKGRFQRWAEIYGRVVILVFLFAGVLPFLDRLSGSVASRLLPVREGTGVLFCLLTALFFWLANLPTDLYATFGPREITHYTIT